jgi:hypothetical protein
METKKTALQIAGEAVENSPESLMELGKWVGRGQAFGMISAKASAAQAQCLKRIKDGAEYKTLGLTWDQFCVTHVGVTRPTADKVIAAFEEFGAAYFNLSTVIRISPTNFRQIAGVVNDSEIEIDGEKVAIVKGNSARISEAIAALRKTVEAKEERIQEQARDTKKLNEEKNAAKKAVERERLAFQEYKRQQSERFANATPEQASMLDAQSYFDLAMAKLSVLGGKELSVDDQARFIGLGEYMYRALIQSTFDAREKFGKGWNMCDPSDMVSMDQVAPNARNLIAEYVEKNTKSRK